MAALAHGMLVRTQQGAQPAVREALALEPAQLRLRKRGQAAAGEPALGRHQVLDLRQEPGIDRGFLEHLVA